VPKIERNRQRDAKALLELERLGWNIITIWECDLVPKNRLVLREKLQEFMSA
jgi:DNA mismatch endonuclease (patch repair protein)